PTVAGCGNPSALPPIDRFSSFGKAGPRLDLGEHEQMTPSGDNIDFSEGTSTASRQNTEPFRDQESGCPAFRRHSHAERCLSLRPWGGLGAMWSIGTRPHAC